MRCMNTDKEHEVKFTADGTLYRCPPGGSIDVPDLYCRAREGANAGQLLPSTLQALAPQLRPERELPSLPAAPARGPRGAAAMIADGMAPGRAEVEAERQRRASKSSGAEAKE